MPGPSLQPCRARVHHTQPHPERSQVLCRGKPTACRTCFPGSLRVDRSLESMRPASNGQWWGRLGEAFSTWGQHLGWTWRPGDGQRLQKRSPRGSVGEAPRDQPGGPAWTLPIRTWGGDEGLALPAQPLSLWAWLLLLGFFSYSLFLFAGLFSPRWR